MGSDSQHSCPAGRGAPRALRKSLPMDLSPRVIGVLTAIVACFLLAGATLRPPNSEAVAPGRFRFRVVNTDRGSSGDGSSSSSTTTSTTTSSSTSTSTSTSTSSAAATAVTTSASAAPQRPAQPTQRRRLTLVFGSNQLGLRGTEVAVFDYALWAEVLFDGVTCHFLFPEGRVDPVATAKFNTTFPGRIATFKSTQLDLDRVLARLRADYYYKIGPGLSDEPLIPTRVPAGVHAVFACTHRRPEYAAFAAISDFVAGLPDGRCSGTVPHMTWMLDCPGADLRASLGIPPGATVFAWYGGHDAWDKNMNAAVLEAAAARRGPAGTAFLFRNLGPDDERAFRAAAAPNVHLLPPSASMRDKCAFIRTADVFMHTQERGETFGLAVAEFSLLQRPIITKLNTKGRFHISVLSPDLYGYEDAAGFRRHLMTITARRGGRGSSEGGTGGGNILAADFRARYANFTPARVMGVFNRHFLNGSLTSALLRERPGLLDQHVFPEAFFAERGYSFL